MTDPRRALGREDDVRVDAQLIQETISSGAPVGITYQVQNLTEHPIAIADKLCDVSYDIDSRTITLSVGSEVPKNGEMPHLTLIAGGAKKTMTIGAMLHVTTPSVRSPFVSVPQYLEIHVNVLRDLASFQALIDEQGKTTTPIMLTDRQFDEWLQNNDTIFLNAIPVHYVVAPKSNLTDASRGSNGGGSF